MLVARSVQLGKLSVPFTSDFAERCWKAFEIVHVRTTLSKLGLERENGHSTAPNFIKSETGAEDN